MVLRAAGRRIWASAVFNSWASILIRTGGFAILLPLVLVKLPPEEVGVWLLFSSILTLQALVDFGLSPTFTRAIAYTQAATDALIGGGVNGAAAKGDIADVILAMRSAYTRLTGLVLLLVATVGTACLIRPMSHLASPQEGWIAWVFVVVGGAASIYNIMYVSILQGVNQIALLRRWEVVTGSIGIGGAVLALILGLGLVGMVAAYQIGSLVAVVVNRQLSRAYTPVSAWTRQALQDPGLPSRIWSSGWRSGLGVMMTFGVIQGSGIAYAQLASPAQVASFLFAQRLIQVMSSVSQVPFYTRIPSLARLYAENQRSRIIDMSRVGMGFSNWLLVGGVVGGWFVVPPLMALIGSTTAPPDAALWWGMAVALLLERVGAMYLQTYSITNRIVWHVANGISGVIMLLVSVPLYRAFGALGIPLSWVAGYALFYLPYSAYISMKAFPPGDLLREFCVNGLPMLVVAGACFCLLIR